MATGKVTGGPRSNRQHLSDGKPCRDKDQALADDWPSRARMAGAIFDSPEFVARQRIIAIKGLGSLTQKSQPTIKSGDLTRGKSFAEVALCLHTAIRLEVPEPGHLIYTWSYGWGDQPLQVRDIGDVRLVE